MCDFFSFLTINKGDYLYLNAEQRKELGFKWGDSHSKTARVYYEQNKGCKVNAYEYNPLTQELTKGSVLFEEDYNKILEWCKNLDFKTIVPELIVKPIVNPFHINHDTITDLDIQRLKEWASIGASVWASVRTNVGISVRDSVRDSVWDSVWDTIWASVGASVGASVKDSVGGSIYAYISSFFNLDGKWKWFEDIKGNPFQSCIDLWESGLVPSFDGRTWRLHNNKGIAYESQI